MEIRVTPTHTFKLDQSLDLEQRKEYIDEVLNTTLYLDDMTATVEEYFRHTWDKRNTIVCMDIIGYYLTKCPDNRNKHDKEVMSWKKEKQMKKGSPNYKNFSDLGIQDQLRFGFKDYEDEAEKQKKRNQEII